VAGSVFIYKFALSRSREIGLFLCFFYFAVLVTRYRRPWIGQTCICSTGSVGHLGLSAPRHQAAPGSCFWERAQPRGKKMTKRKAADPVLSAILDVVEEDGGWLLIDDVARDADLEDPRVIGRRARTLGNYGFHFFPDRSPYMHIARCSSRA